MQKEIRTAYILFLLAILFTFGFICLLQFVSFPLFFLVLLLMHGGVVLFIVSKKLFKKAGAATFPYYKREYILLALYLPILLYKILGNFGLYTVNIPVKSIVSLCLTGVCLVVSGLNAYAFYKGLSRK